MPRDQWARNKKPKPRGRNRKVKPEVAAAWDRFEKLLAGDVPQMEVQQASTPKQRHRKHSPTSWERAKRDKGQPWVRPAYTDFPPVTDYEYTHEYDPELYGRPAGSTWPKTRAEAAAG